MRHLAMSNLSISAALSLVLFMAIDEYGCGLKLEDKVFADKLRGVWKVFIGVEI